jgi:hypothetical protein
MISSAGRRVRCRSGCPTVGAGIVSPTGVIIGESISSAPDDHLTTGPYSCVSEPPSRDIDPTCGCPSAGGRIEPSATVEIDLIVALPAPNDHLSACPDCAV